MEFQCRLVSVTGQITEGVYAADSETSLRHELEERGMHVLALQPKGVLGRWSFAVLRRGVKDQVFRPVLDAVHDRVKAGTALSDAFDEHGELVPRVYTASLLAG